MSIIVNKNTRVIVQGITGTEGTFHSTQMIKFFITLHVVG